ncbi:MAG: RluA family pseudouridine synthase [Verrucomicrobiales bacterium]
MQEQFRMGSCSVQRGETLNVLKTSADPWEDPVSLGNFPEAIDITFVAKPKFMELGWEVSIPILYEDRSVMAIDKPAYWLLVPPDWEDTDWNLQLAIMSSIQGGEYWAQSRNLKFLRFIHRLDGETTGIVLFSKSQGGTSVYSQLFESRQMQKTYLAVVEGEPKEERWVATGKIIPDAVHKGKMRIDNRNGKEAETRFSVLQSKDGKTLLEAEPLTGRTHQIRLHLAEAGFPVVGDRLYGRGNKIVFSPDKNVPLRKKPDFTEEFPLALRAIALNYPDPFLKRRIYIEAPSQRFVDHFGFERLEKPARKPTADKPPKGQAAPQNKTQEE